MRPSCRIGTYMKKLMFATMSLFPRHLCRELGASDVLRAICFLHRRDDVVLDRDACDRIHGSPSRSGGGHATCVARTPITLSRCADSPSGSARTKSSRISASRSLSGRLSAFWDPADRESQRCCGASTFWKDRTRAKSSSMETASAFKMART